MRTKRVLVARLAALVWKADVGSGYTGAAHGVICHVWIAELDSGKMLMRLPAGAMSEMLAKPLGARHSHVPVPVPHAVETRLMK